MLGLFGVEYAISFVHRRVDSYDAWLIQNSGASPLYPSGLAFNQP